MKVIYHGPRATIQAPPGRTFLAFDADGLHYRIAATRSQDSFMLSALRKYDETKDILWKPHIRNSAAIFGVSPEVAVGWAKEESPKYTFSKNFIYMLLNGGDVPALKGAAVSAGLDLNEAEVRKLLNNFLNNAKGFKAWRERLLKEAMKTGMITLESGRRRRFWQARYDSMAKVFRLNEDTIKEVYNFPLIGTEVDFMNPRIKAASDVVDANEGWMFVLHSHDGFMIEGPEAEADAMEKKVLGVLDPYYTISPGVVLYVPFGSKRGNNWAYLK